MTAKGHMLLAIPIVASSSAMFGFEELDIPLFLFAGILGSLLPDIDEPNSYIGRRTVGLSHLISLFVKHRGVTHFLFVPILIFWSSFLFSSPTLSVFMKGIAVGWLAHLIGDLLTKGGIKGFFYPFFLNKTVGLLPKRLRFYTGSITETVFMVFLMPIALVSLYVIGVL